MAARVKPQRLQSLINAWAIVDEATGEFYRPLVNPGVLPGLWHTRDMARFVARHMVRKRRVVPVQVTVVER